MSHAHERCAILSIGDELVLGQSLDTNSRWLSERLLALGVVPVEHVTVPDDLEAHVRTLQRLAGSVNLIVSSGGLGPTDDDLSRDALARATNDTLVEDVLALAQVEAFFASRGRTMNELNRRQALRPSRGVVLPNLNGTAPGLFSTISTDVRTTCDVFCLPGPPREMMPMFEAQVVPRLILPGGRTVRTRVLHTFGLAESELAKRLGPLMDRNANPLVGTTASGGVVSIRMRYEGSLSPTLAERELDRIEAISRDAAGPYIFGSGDDTLAKVVVGLLKLRGESLTCVESCTGGLLSAAITDVPGSSSVFHSSLITYANSAKVSLAGVAAERFSDGGPGAVSIETARDMALGGLHRMHAQHALAITGIAGPDGGTATKPVGTVCIARASKGDSEVDARTYLMAGDRASIREWSVKSALAMLWQHLAGLPALTLLRQK